MKLLIIPLTVLLTGCTAIQPYLTLDNAATCYRIIGELASIKPDCEETKSTWPFSK